MTIAVAMVIHSTADRQLLRSELSERRQKGEARQPKAGKQKGNHSTAARQ